ncbi:MAG: DegV family protein [Anaerolineales bacterium]|nr:DegV family protein [Anaerolineales bacterium]MCB0007131.1 DegV family protein [Anaerolineales bacterium]MCB0017917.1 DegV family protein [Anaerolineales bacterium]MCB8962002.1 DegV family protein [Ardenticatenales bacterium]
MTIKIVTDGVTDITPAMAAEHGITVVPAYVNIGGRSFIDGVDLSREQFYANLASYPTHPTTAAAAAGVFTSTYEALAAAGATEILSIHIASTVSNFFNAARVGAEAASQVRVHLLDTGQLTMGAGFMALIAAEMAAAGESARNILAALEEKLKRTQTIGFVDTLEFLRRGGRVSRLQASLGSILQVKPILRIAGGEITLIERVRTRTKLMARAVSMMQELAPFSHLALLHANEPGLAAQLAEQATGLVPAGQSIPIVSITPGLGVHIGPGAVGFSCIQL